MSSTTRSPPRSPTTRNSNTHSPPRGFTSTDTYNQHNSSSNDIYDNNYRGHVIDNSHNDRYINRDKSPVRYRDYDRDRIKSPPPRDYQRYNRDNYNSHNTTPKTRNTGYSINIRHIPPNCTVDDLRVEFEQFGDILDIYIPRDYYTQRPRDFAYISYKTYEQADEAVRNMNNKNIKNSYKPLYIIHAVGDRKTPQQMISIEKSKQRDNYSYDNTRRYSGNRDTYDRDRYRDRYYDRNYDRDRYSRRYSRSPARRYDDRYDTRRPRSPIRERSPPRERTYRGRSPVNDRYNDTLSRSPSPQQRSPLTNRYSNDRQHSHDRYSNRYDNNDSNVNNTRPKVNDNDNLHQSTSTVTPASQQQQSSFIDPRSPRPNNSNLFSPQQQSQSQSNRSPPIIQNNSNQ